MAEHAAFNFGDAIETRNREMLEMIEPPSAEEAAA